MNNIKGICFEDIQTRDLLYYDPDFKEDCFHFCQERDIDCLPALNNPLKFYRKTETAFKEEIIKPERIVDSETYIFDQSLLERFRTNSILFVYAKKELTGVVHFSDFNRPAVGEYLYCQLSAYERSLRKLLILRGLKNQDMIDYFKSAIKTNKKEEMRFMYSKKKKEYEKKWAQNQKLPVFECFYLLDLIELAGYRNIVLLSPGANNLRNMVMHAHDLVIKCDPHRDDYIYSFESFEKFYNQVSLFIQDYKKVNNKIAFLE